MADKKKRLEKLEAKMCSGSGGPRVVLVMPGETKEQAIFRMFGSDGLPPTDAPHIIVIPVSPKPRPEITPEEKQHD